MPLIGNISKTGNCFADRARFARVLWAVSCMRRTYSTLNGDKPMDELSSCKSFVDVSLLRLERTCIVLKVAGPFSLSMIFYTDLLEATIQGK